MTEHATLLFTLENTVRHEIKKLGDPLDLIGPEEPLAESLPLTNEFKVIDDKHPFVKDVAEESNDVLFFHNLLDTPECEVIGAKRSICKS